MSNHTIEKIWFTKVDLKAVCLFFDEVGHRCGYVGLLSSHPLYGKDYMEHCDCLLPHVKKRLNEPCGKMNPITMLCCGAKDKTDLSGFNTPEIIFNVHGGLTFSTGDGKYPIEEKDIWWFGFDCGHAGDKSKYSHGEGEERTKEYVIAECESLAEQLIRIEYSVTKAEANQ